MFSLPGRLNVFISKSIQFPTKLSVELKRGVIVQRGVDFKALPSAQKSCKAADVMNSQLAVNWFVVRVLVNPTGNIYPLLLTALSPNSEYVYGAERKMIGVCEKEE